MVTGVTPPPPYQSRNEQGVPAIQRWHDWFRQIDRLIEQAFVWTNFDFTGSDLDDIIQKDHNQLDAMQGGDSPTDTEMYHLTMAEHDSLISGLQGSYDLQPVPDQITVNDAQPLTIDLTSAAQDVFALRDELNNDILRVSDTAFVFSETLYGGTVAGTTLTLQGANNTPDVGIVDIASPLTLSYDTFSNTTPAQQFAMNWAPTFTASSAYVGGCLQVAPTVTITTGTFIPATFSDTSNMLTAAVPGFSAFTFINELAVIRNSGNFNLMSALVINVGLTHQRDTSGTSTTPGTTGMNFSAQTKATVSGAVMTKTAQTGLIMAPTFSTVAGSTTNLGTIIGLRCNNPIPGLFQPQAGTETLGLYIGLEMNAIPFGGNVGKAAVRSFLTAATNSYFLLNVGGAQSDFGGAHIFDVGIVQHLGDGILFSNSWGAAGGDLLTYWDGTGFTHNPLVGQDLLFRYATDGHTLTATTPSTAQFRVGHEKFAFGQTGVVGNQVGIFVANTRTVSIGGDWSDFLLTQAGNLTVDAAMGTVAAWTVNAPSITLGTGSVTTGVGLLVGGNPNQGTNRYGLSVISSPSGGTLNYCARFSGAAGVRIDGVFEHTGTTFGMYGTTPVVQSAAYTPTNVTPDRAYDADSTTVDELSDVLGTLIADLQLVGIIG